MKAATARAGVQAPGVNWLLSQMPLVALIVLCIVATLLSSRFLSGINITNADGKRWRTSDPFGHHRV